MHELFTRFLRGAVSVSIGISVSVWLVVSAFSGGEGGGGDNHRGDSRNSHLDDAELILFFVGISFLAVMYCWDWFHRRQFKEAVSEARKKQITVNHCLLYRTMQNAPPIFETYEGDFDMKYKNRVFEVSGSAKIQLKNNRNGGYEIKGENHVHSARFLEGESQDADAAGRVVITEGFVSYSGDAWWKEVVMDTPDRGIKVLVEGRFNFTTDSFTGYWRTSKVLWDRPLFDQCGRGYGQHKELRARNVSKLLFRPSGTLGSNHIQTLAETLEENIPMADAMAETPSDLVETVPLVQEMSAIKSTGSGLK